MADGDGPRTGIPASGARFFTDAGRQGTSLFRYCKGRIALMGPVPHTFLLLAPAPHEVLIGLRPLHPPIHTGTRYVLRWCRSVVSPA